MDQSAQADIQSWQQQWLSAVAAMVAVVALVAMWPGPLDYNY